MIAILLSLFEGKLIKWDLKNSGNAFTSTVYGKKRRRDSGRDREGRGERKGIE